jgi:transcriptional regulator with XRE-family HTH domain
MAALGISVYALQNKHHISMNTIRHWELRTGRPRPDSIRRLAEALQVTVPDLCKSLGVKPADFSEVGVFLAEARKRKQKKEHASA